MRAHELLGRAAQIVRGDREAQHGPKERNHQNIAAHWNAYLGNRLRDMLTPLDVALMMIELKIARAKAAGAGNVDNYVDMAGYAGVAGEIAMAGREDPEELPMGAGPNRQALEEGGSFMARAYPPPSIEIPEPTGQQLPWRK
jgi:hypothetical protein